jgi:hypothetical protein
LKLVIFAGVAKKSIKLNVKSYEIYICVVEDIAIDVVLVTNCITIINIINLTGGD